ncbi:protein trichome birefringence-like 26 isoform X2 [Phoenix dactylifera]|uniref:Protein trichome birefringence-like 26 isoform X2 n=1 Tax=Phoenix dactylifera TaxID=42345 RepID=A0A8B9ADH9_PHODC|nr:protein trichome birefringence-like 26 isoform X2 [Phoenix dactylifera]
MGKDMKTDMEPIPSPHKRVGNFLIKVFGSALLLAFSYRLLFSDPTGFFVFSSFPASEMPAPKDSPSMENTVAPYTRLPQMALHLRKGDSLKEQCDLFSGEWIPNSSGPRYTNSSCSYIDPYQDCLTNGRPDRGYLYWRWKPYGCDLPPFDAEKFLKAMRNKSLAFIGDSIFRNQIESLLCLLSQVEEAVEIYHDETFQSKTWYFSSHNFTLALIWAPFLLKAELKDSGNSNDYIQLHLDALDDTWTSQYGKHDYIVMSGGQWFLKTTIFWENSTIIGCHNCPGKNFRELGMDYSYQKALELAFRFITASHHKPLVVLRTWTPDHFEYGEWYNGGVCNRTEPYKEGEFSGDPVDPMMRGLEIEEFEKAATIGSENGTRLKLLDSYHLSLLRPDGHPGPYRKLHPDISKRPQNDCLHWCLPGPIDTWNNLLMEIVLNDGGQRYSS